MIHSRLLPVLRRLARPAVFAAVAFATLAGAAITTPASAWWSGGYGGGYRGGYGYGYGYGGGYRGGFYVAPPVYIAPPIYAAPAYPPAYYAPPPVMYTQPSAPPPPSVTGQSCNAGPYVCPMDRPVASGSACYCLSNERSKIWGRAG